MGKKHFYITGYLGEGAKRMLRELEEEQNVTLIPEEIDNRILRFLYYRIMGKIGFQKESKVKAFFQKFFKLSNLKPDYGADNYFVFWNSKFWSGYDLNYIKIIRNMYPKVKLILYIVDPMKASFSKVCSEELLDQFNLVFSINKQDCEEYGFQYYPLVYSDVKKTQTNISSKYGLYYLGSGSDRTEKLYQVSRICEENEIRYSFNVLQKQEFEKLYSDKIHYMDQIMSYDENIEYVKSSNCLLELMHQDFDNPTQRYLEAVVYNKKLLTDNKKIIEFPFYDERYMHIIKEYDEIDAEWVKKVEEVNYNYDGYFSPRNMLSYIESII